MTQWINPAKTRTKGPELILPGLAGGLEVEDFHIMRRPLFLSDWDQKLGSGGDIVMDLVRCFVTQVGQ